MASFNVQLDHQQTRESAAEKLRDFSGVVLSDLPAGVTDVSEKWNDDGSLEFAFKAMGMQLKGTMIIGGDNVTVDGTMPFAALPFRGAIEEKILEKLQTALV